MYRGVVASRPANFVTSASSPPIAPVGEDGIGKGGKPRFPEIDCLRGRLDPDVIAAAEKRAARIGVGADRVLVTQGVVAEETYLRMLAVSLNQPFDTLENATRRQCSLDDSRLIDALVQGILPLVVDGILLFVIAPRDVRHFLGAMASNPSLAQRIRLTTPEHLRSFVLKNAARALGERASSTLQSRYPTLSAAPPRWRVNTGGVGIAACVTLLSAVLAPAAALTALELALAAGFLAWSALRLIGAFVPQSPSRPLPPLREDQLPTYTIISALYHEAASVQGLLASFERFEYPAEKLNILLVTEEDDPQTRAAIAAYRGSLAIETIIAPASGPQTKPKALNVALPFARGAFTVIYDAEDRPEPDQLIRALNAFRKAHSDLACVQARLAIDNTTDSWLAAMFSAEYAGHFDVFLPGLSALQLPLPLGGSSNHFRTATLRAVGGWDAHNVTEDADLGIRLARFGYRAAIIDSTTFEEATARVWPWLRQRTRWFKGWLQTWCVHMRRPYALLRELGPINFIAFQLLIAGNVLATLVHPVFFLTLIYLAAQGSMQWLGNNAAFTAAAAFYGTTAASGYLTSAFLGWRGLVNRNLQSAAWVLLLTPIHWLLLSLAAWRAFYQFLFNPYGWEKTEHGAANRNGARNVTRSLSILEQHLGAFETATLVPSATTATEA